MRDEVQAAVICTLWGLVAIFAVAMGGSTIYGFDSCWMRKDGGRA